MLEQYGHKRGYEDGWRARTAGKLDRPSPQLGAALLSPAYLAAYQRGYREGYAAAERDQAFIRRTALLREMRRRQQSAKAQQKSGPERGA